MNGLQGVLPACMRSGLAFIESSATRSTGICGTTSDGNASSLKSQWSNCYAKAFRRRPGVNSVEAPALLHAGSDSSLVVAAYLARAQDSAGNLEVDVVDHPSGGHAHSEQWKHDAGRGPHARSRATLA